MYGTKHVWEYQACMGTTPITPGVLPLAVSDAKEAVPRVRNPLRFELVTVLTMQGLT